MKNLISPCLLFFLLGFWISDLQASPVKNISRKGNGLEIISGGRSYRIELCTPSMFRVRAATANGFVDEEPWMVVQYDWPAVPFALKTKKNTFTLSTDALMITGTVEPFRIQVYNASHELVHADAEGPGLHTGYHGDTAYCRKKLFADEHFFGFGERMDFIDQRGKMVTLDVGRGMADNHTEGAYNILKANYAPVPFMMSTRGYGIFFHNSFRSDWDMGYSNTQQYAFRAKGGELDYYFIYGPSFASIIGQYTGLTGRTPLMPRFALGLHVGTYSGGTWGYEDLTSQYYVVQLARKLRELGIPADILHLDSTWRIFGKKSGKGGTTFEWRQPGFPDPKAMFDSLYGLHFQMAGLHIRPRIDNGNVNNYLEMAHQAGVTYPENGQPGDFPDYFNETAVDWWWENCLLPLAKQGCKFVKTDEGSAFGHKGNEIDRVGPTGKEAERLHNVFPIAYAKAPFEQFMQYNDMRGMNHTREGFAGIQRYPFIFAGDWPSEWQYFEPVIRAGINCGLSGIGAWTHCMGGFEHIADPELYIRWCQFGMFSPVAMLFGMEHPNYKEPWQYGEQALTIFRDYDRLRYRLIPYLYTAYYSMYSTGMPVMRALALLHQDDPNTYGVDDQYYFGDHLLICPVTEKDAVSRIVYLPKGTWFDYWSGRKYDGRQHLLVRTPLEKMPIFVKGGAIIPMQPVRQYTVPEPPDSLIFEIFPEGNSDFTLYEDDGISLYYREGMYSQTKIECREENNGLRLIFHPAAGQFKTVHENYQLKIHWDQQPKSISAQHKDGMIGLEAAVSITASPLPQNSWFYDKEKRLLHISCKPDNTAGFELMILK